jgi:hypothetical protein
VRERENYSALHDQHMQLRRQQEVLAAELMVALGSYKPKANIDAGALERPPVQRMTAFLVSSLCRCPCASTSEEGTMWAFVAGGMSVAVTGLPCCLVGCRLQLFPSACCALAHQHGDLEHCTASPVCARHPTPLPCSRAHLRVLLPPPPSLQAPLLTSCCRC